MDARAACPLELFMRSLYLCGLIVICAVSSAFAADRAADLSQLTAGVSNLGVEGSPGPLVAFGPNAFVVVVGDSRGAKLPLVAAARYGKGRVVAFGHDGYLGATKLDGPKFFINVVAWTSGKAAKTARVVVHRHNKVMGVLKKQGIQVAQANLTQLQGADVLIINSMHLKTDAEVKQIQKFIQDGGGVITAGLGWAWLGYFAKGGTLANDFKGNQLLRPAGIAWSEGSLKATGPGRFVVDASAKELAHAGQVFKSLVAHDSGGKKLNKAALSQASAVLTGAASALPADEPLLIRHISAMAAKRGASAIPSAKTPLKKNKPLDRVLLTLELSQLTQTPVDKIKAHPAAADFPGAIPAGAKRVQRKISVDTTVPGWHSTGLYAGPGEVITVTVPDASVGKVRIRIGAHKDRIFHHDEWKRAPRITREYMTRTASGKYACAFGGPIYVVAPKKAIGTIQVSIGNAVEAPLYVHGVTKLADWKATIRNRPAPWAEIGSDRIFVTVPSRVVRNMDDPAALMEAWNKVLDQDAELSGIPTKRKRPERMVPDRQISAGYMHSGYPIMMHLDHEKKLADLDHLVKGNWGFFHELGHNHQRPNWTFSGTTEVTCNLYTLYNYEFLCGVKPKDNPRTSPQARKKRAGKYLKNPDFNKWKSSPFLALDMYVLMQEAFGWESFRKVFAEYRTLSSKDRPRNDDQKRDQWLVRYSRTVGRNLGPYFQKWGVPTTQAARDSIKELPIWMPKEMGGKG
jgi:hypothetical protein